MSPAPLLPADLAQQSSTPDGIPALRVLAEAALPDFLQRQRWYPAKDAGRPDVTLSALLPLAVPGVPAAITVWRVTPPGQPPMRLFVPLALVASGEEAPDPRQVIAVVPAQAGQGRGESRIVEAFALDAFVRTWIDLVLRGGEAAAGAVRLRTGRTGQLARAGLEPGGGWAVRRGSAEQSNTSIRIGDGAILKVLRKIEDGSHPELEMGRFLTETAGFAATPPLLGWTELDSAESDVSLTLSILQSFVPNEGDGWSWVLVRLARASEPGEDGAALGEASLWLGRSGPAYRRIARRLGDRRRRSGVPAGTGRARRFRILGFGGAGNGQPGARWPRRGQQQTRSGDTKPG